MDVAASTIDNPHTALFNPTMIQRLTLLVLTALLALPAARADAPIEMIVYSKTSWFRHPDIGRISGYLAVLGSKHGINVSITEDAKDLSARNHEQYDLILFNNSTNLGESLTVEERKPIIEWFHKGGGIMVMHAGIVQNGTWPELIEIAGCDFHGDSEFVEARFLVDPKAEGDPIVAGKSREFTYTADWLNFDKSVTGLPGVEVLLRLDEKSYVPVRDIPFYKDMKPMGADHPICWRRTLGKGRFFFTGLGHDVRSIDTDFGRPHLLAGIRWTAGRAQKATNKAGE